MRTLLEGVDAIRQPCTIGVLVPAVAVVLAARSRAGAAAVGYVVGASVLSWAQAARYWTVPDVPPATVVAGLIAALAVTAIWGASRWPADLSFGGAVIVGAVAGWLWRPCVGPRLADILNNADTDGARTLALMTLYLLGATVPALVVAAAPSAWPRLAIWRDAVVTRSTGLLVSLAWAAAIVVGVYDELLAELLRRSSIQ